MQMQSAIDHVSKHARHGRLDCSDLTPDLAGIRLVFVDKPSCIEYVQPELRDLRVGVGDFFLGQLLLRKRLTFRVPA
jgi:hypothetical protein